MDGRHRGARPQKTHLLIVRIKPRCGTWVDGRPLDSRVVSAGVELTRLDLSYLGKSIRAEISRLKEQLTELKDEVRRLTGLLKYLGKSRPRGDNSDPSKIDAELAFQRSLDRLDC